MKAILLIICFAISCNAIQARHFGEKKNSDYQNWYPCLIIARNDTIHGKVKPKNEYFGRGSFTMLFESGKERAIKPRDVAQLWIINPGDTDRYLSVQITRNDYPVTILYRIIVDGSCKLLFSEGIRPVNMLTLGVGTGYSYTHIFTIYYKGELWEVLARPADFVMDPETDFQSLGHKVFNECITVAYRLETGQYEIKDIRQVVKEFNACIADGKPLR